MIHKRDSAKNLSVLDESNPNRIKMYKLKIRNQLVIVKSYKTWKELIIFLLYYFLVSLKALCKSKKHRILRFKTVQAGIFEFFLGTYDKKKFDNRFNNINAHYLDEYLVKSNDQVGENA